MAHLLWCVLLLDGIFAFGALSLILPDILLGGAFS